jgi:hypothetical protein
MTDRTVSVNLRMRVRDYLTGGESAIAMNRRLQESQRALGNESSKTAAELTKVGAAAEKHGRSTGRGALYGAAGIAALGAAGGGIKALPPLLAATAAGAAVIPQVLLGSAAAGLVLKSALGGVGDEMKKVVKAQDQFGTKLAPNAEALVGQYARLRPALKAVQQELQQNALAGTAAGMDLLVSKTLPQVSGGLNKLATDWSEMFAELALATNSPEFVGMFNGVTATADRFFDQINDRIRPLTKSVATLVTSADPVARAFGDGIAGAIDRFNASVERARANGDLAELFAGGTAAARELMMISEDIIRITGMVIREANKTNDATGSAGQSLRAYVESGRAAEDVVGIVHTLTTAWEGLRDVLGPIGELLRDALADPGMAASIAQTFQVLAVGSQVIATVLRIILALNEATGGLLLPLVGLALASGKLTAAIGLTTAAAARGAAALTAYGVAGARAGTMLEKGAAGAGKLLGALFALQAVSMIFDQFDDAGADVEKLDAAIQGLAKGAAVAGTEIDRVFNKGWGDMNAQAMMASPDDWFGKFLADAEEAIPLTGQLARAFGSPSFVQSKENFAALDASMAKYGQTSNDVKGMTEAWNRVSKESGIDQVELAKLLPATAAEMARLQTETHRLESGFDGASERAALLAAPLNEAVTAARSLLDVFTELNGGAIGFARAQLAAEGAVDKLNAGLKENGLALNASKTGFDILREKGAANQGMLLDVAEAAAKAAQARIDEGGSVTQAAAVYDQYINRLRAALAAQGATPATIDAIIGKYAQMPPSMIAAAEAANELNGKLQGIPKGTKFTFNGTEMVDGSGKALALGESLRGLPKGQTFTWNGKNLVDGKGKVVDLQAAIQDLPPSKATRVTVPGVDPATGKVRGLAEELQGLPDGLANIQVNNGGALAAIRQVRQSLANLGGGGVVNMRGGAYLPRQFGGVRAAAEGLLQPQIAPPGTRYQWAEPETGGELFLPRRGINVRRGRALLNVAANWYGGEFVPTKAMRLGGYRAAAAGLVNVAPSSTATTSTTRATRLDYVESYLRARDAAKALSASLKENGRSFSFATAKGRENRSAVIAGIRAAQDAAKTKHEETGSVKAANAVYAEHIRRLNATLAAQKVGAATRRQLLAVAGRPQYDLPDKAVRAPVNSDANKGYARALIAVAGGRGDLADKLSLNRAGTSTATEEGRENLGAILDFLDLAQRAAQERFTQTKSSKLATAVYNIQIAELRKILAGAGYSAAVVNSILASYGKITLTPNREGGAYMAASGLASLSRASIFPAGGAPMYGFAEPGTGGELFVPKNGDRQRGQDLLSIGAGWYGGKFVAAGQSGGGGSYDYSTHMTVNARTYNPSPAELLDHQRTVDAHARSGRRY